VSELPISDEAVEAAAKALWDTDPVLSQKSPWGANQGVMDEGLRRSRIMVEAFLRAEGFEIGYGRRGKSNLVVDVTGLSIATHFRFRGRWKPIPEPTSTEGEG